MIQYASLAMMNFQLQKLFFKLGFLPENQILSVDESKFYCPPNKLHLPDNTITSSDSAFSMPESDVSSSESSSPTYSKDVVKEMEVEMCKTSDNKVTILGRYR